MEPYLVCVLLKPTPDEVQRGEVETLVVAGSTVLAKDQNQAAIKAMKLVPTTFDGKEDRLEVRVLPFQRSSK